jgi:hypothetical protein
MKAAFPGAQHSIIWVSLSPLTDCHLPGWAGLTHPWFSHLSTALTEMPPLLTPFYSQASGPEPPWTQLSKPVPALPHDKPLCWVPEQTGFLYEKRLRAGLT